MIYGRQRTPETQQAIDHIINMKMVENRSHQEILAYVTQDLGKSLTYAYQLWNKAKIYIDDVTKKMRLDAMEEAVLRLEKQYQIAEKEKNRRMMLDIQKELNKLNGLYNQDKVTTNIVFKAKWGGQS